MKTMAIVAVTLFGFLDIMMLTAMIVAFSTEKDEDRPYMIFGFTMFFLAFTFGLIFGIAVLKRLNKKEL